MVRINKFAIETSKRRHCACLCSIRLSERKIVVYAEPAPTGQSLRLLLDHGYNIVPHWYSYMYNSKTRSQGNKV